MSKVKVSAQDVHLDVHEFKHLIAASLGDLLDPQTESVEDVAILAEWPNGFQVQLKITADYQSKIEGSSFGIISLKQANLYPIDSKVEVWQYPNAKTMGYYAGTDDRGRHYIWLGGKTSKQAKIDERLGYKHIRLIEEVTDE